MANIIQNNQVIYVEPNAMDDFTTYKDSVSGRSVRKSVNNEDLCITVELEVEIKGRTSYGTDNGNSNIKLTWQSTTTGQSVNFMSGSKIHFDNGNGGWINSLTTNYTENTTLNDIANKGTAEMFGIKSIDISYNNFMVPQVTIQFTDVRGTSLFVQEELRHNLVSNGVQYSANNNIEGSFFKSFFMFPYPKFTLKVKGFYGEPVSYELTCHDCRTAFDANTGCYDVTANFIGYAFSFLSDITTNVLLSAPYSSYIGEDYWNEHIKDDFVVKNEKGQNVPMERLGEICKKYKNIQESVQTSLSENDVTDLMREVGYSNDDAKLVENEAITDVINAYNNLINFLRCKAYNLNPEISEGDCYIPAEPNPTYNSIAIFSNADINDLVPKSGTVETYLTSLKEAFKRLNQNSSEQAKALNEWYQNYSDKIEIKYTSDCWEAIKSQDALEKWFVDENLRSDVTAKQKNYAYGTTTYESAWTHCDNSNLYVYNDYGLGDIITKTQVQAYNSQEINNIKVDVANKLINREFNNIFNFYPTVENITKIIMAHLETYIQMITHCSNVIIQSGADRNVDTLNVSLDDFNDTKGKQIAPFPSVTKVVDDGGVRRRENAWLGNLSSPDKFEEISLVNGLLAGIEGVTHEINYAVMQSGTSVPKEYNRCSSVIPTSYLDLFVPEIENGITNNVFGSDTDLDDLDDVWMRFYAHGYTTLYTQDKKSDNYFAKEVGKADALNFFKYYGDRDLSRIRNYLNTMDVNDDFISNSYLRFYRTVKSEVDDGNGKYEVMLFLPVKNWNTDIITGADTNLYTYSDRYTVLPMGTFLYTTYDIGAGCGITNSIHAEDRYLEYIKHSLSNIGTNYPKLSEYFKNTSFGEDKFKQKITGAYKYTDLSNETHFIQKEIILNSDGSVSNGESLCFNLTIWKGGKVSNCYFFTDMYSSIDRNADDYYEQCAFMFIDGLQGLDSVPFDANAFSVNKTGFMYLPKIQFLKYCAWIWHAYKYGDESRYKAYIEKTTNANGYYCFYYFANWANNVYPKLLKPFIPEYKEEYTQSTLEQKVNNSNKTTGDLINILNECLNNYSQLSIVYDFEMRYGGFVAGIRKPSSAMAKLVNELFQVTTVCIQTCMNLKNVSYDTTIDNQYMKSYFIGVKEELTELLGTTSSQSNVASVSIEFDKQNEDIKVGVYNYIKMLYDKWIASGDNAYLYNMNNMFEGKNKMFHFIDSAYNHIGDEMFVNLGSFVDCLVESQTKANYPLLSLLSTLYAQNKFQFLCVQNFLDFSNPKVLNKIFKPIPYIQAEEPKNHQDFVVLYPYEASSKLDIPESDYPDDTFYLNDATTYPIMISGKQPDDYVIPSFGVSYGQQYQNYFKSVQVDMSNPMSTEQSITAKFLVSGANNTGTENNGPRQVTIGQDLYSIYSNNSYTCTVTMLGCAWVQPIMYFVLLNVPFFRGSYMVVKVSHQIEAGNMTTSFTGIRMSRTATRAVRNFLYSNTLYSSNGYVPLEEQRSNKLACIDNTCSYSYYSPASILYEDSLDSSLLNKFTIGLNGEQLTSEQQANVLKFLPEMKAAADKYMTSGSVDWFVLANIAEVESSWKSSIIYSGKNKGSSAKGIGQFLYNTAKDNLFKDIFVELQEGEGETNDDRLNPSKSILCMAIYINHIVEYITKEYKDNTALLNDSGKMSLAACAGYKGGKGQANIVASKLLNNPIDTYLDGGVDNSGIESDTFDYIIKIYRGGIGYSRYDLIDLNATDNNDETNAESIAEALTKSIQKSLNNTTKYKSTNITSGSTSDGYVTMTCDNSNDIFAVYDCALSQYSSWISEINWKVNGSINDAAQAIHIKAKTNSSDSTSFTSKMVGSGVDSVRVSKTSDINSNLKTVIVKYIKSNDLGESDIDTIKNRFLYLTDCSDDDIKSLIAEAGTEDSVGSCSSILGGYNNCNIVDDLGDGCASLVAGVTNEKLKKILERCDTFKSQQYPSNYRARHHGIPTMYGSEYVLEKDTYCGCCTSGPKTWYKRAGIDLTFWTGNKPYTYSKSKSALMNSGMVPVYHCNLDTLNSLNGSTGSTYTLNPGDICTIYQGNITVKGKENNGSQHGMMWDGYNWRSDCIQSHANCYSATGSDQGEYAAVIWRSKDIYGESNITQMDGA